MKAQKIGIGIREQMEKSTGIPYKGWSMEDLEKMLKTASFREHPVTPEECFKEIVKHNRRKWSKL